LKLSRVLPHTVGTCRSLSGYAKVGKMSSDEFSMTCFSLLFCLFFDMDMFSVFFLQLVFPLSFFSIVYSFSSVVVAFVALLRFDLNKPFVIRV
jgi:hypothetical protein